MKLSYPFTVHGDQSMHDVRQTDRQTSRLKQCCRELVMVEVWRRKHSPVRGSMTATDMCVCAVLTNRK